MTLSSSASGQTTPDAGVRRYPYSSSTYWAERALCESGRDGAQCFSAATDFDWSPSYDRAPLDDEQLRDQAALYQRGCDLGYEPSCVALAKHFAQGAGVARDEDRARELAARACALKSEPSWSAARGTYWQAVGAGCVILSQLIADPKQIRAALKRACSVGFRGVKGAIFVDAWMSGFPRYNGECGSKKLGTRIASPRH